MQSAALHHRLQQLHAFHTAKGGRYHCRLPVRWKRLRAHCCGRTSEAGSRLEGRATFSAGAAAAGGGGGAGSAPPRPLPWPVWQAAILNASACKHALAGVDPFDLQRKARWPRLGLALDANLSLREQA